MKNRFSSLALAALLLASLGSPALFAQFYEIKHEIINAYGWFGGDNRPMQQRTAGVGQSVLIDTTMTVRSFAFYFRGPFDYAFNPEGRGHAVTLTLNVRDASGIILKTVQAVVPDSFSAGWITWQGINLLAAANTTLIFTCYQVGAYDSAQYTASHGADASQSYTNGVRYGKDGTSDADMESWTDWVVHPSWDSAFRLEGTLGPASNKNCDKTSIGQVPLNDLGTGTYQGYQGGLYPGGSNGLPIAHKAAGLAAAAQVRPLDQSGNVDLTNGKIALISIGPSFATMEFSAFQFLAGQDVSINPKLVLVDGAQSGQSAEQFADTSDNVWNVIAQRLSNANVTSKQVQVAWVKSVNAVHTAGFPADQTKLTGDLATISRNLKAKFPNIKLAYFSSRSYGGYGGSEPYPYETGFAVKWLIENQITGDTTLAFGGANPKAPWLVWGPYFWADGTTPRQDSLVWECSDFQDDGTHPSLFGRAKVARLLLTFFKTDSTTSLWFLRNPPTSVEANRHDSPRAFALEQNYPNPFNPATTIRYVLERDDEVRLVIYNALGKTVRTLVHGHQPAGEHTVVWDGRNDLGQPVASGSYFYQLKVGNTFSTKRMLVLH